MMQYAHHLYKIVDGINHNILFLNSSELPHSIPGPLLEYAKFILQHPTNLVVNFFINDYVPLTWMGMFAILNTQLSDQNKSLYLLNVTPELQQNSPHTNFKIFTQKNNIRECLHTIDNLNADNEENRQRIDALKKNKVNFLRSFTNATIKTLFIQADTPLLRQKIYILKNLPQANCYFQGEIGSILQVESKDFFYGISLSCSRETYLKIISSMVKTTYNEINEENANGLAEITNIVNGQVKNAMSEHFQFDCSIPIVHLDKMIPNKELLFQGKKYTIFKGGETIVIPFQSNKGDFFIEIWYDKEFMKFLT
ncbi:MAG: chemotaxis protein CheX [Oligoflexia bacterium]|nr:chemotaxis protein CheX [Oligoflexia bacterium]MBF0366417.1 chemotaxis protein CheX [Oligoflexia bacterium]